MFSLIITIISIALVAALALATIYYGGTAFSTGNVKASASQVINQAQQIAAAVTMYKNDNGGSVPANVAALVSGNYLGSSPTTTVGTWTLSATGAPYLTGSSLTAFSQSLCDQINTQVGATLAHTWTATAQVSLSTPYACGDDNATATVRYFQYGA